MIFPYRQRIYRQHPADKAVTTYSPLVPIEIIGPTGEVQYDALADTGSQITVFPNIGADTKHLTGTVSSIQAIDGSKLEIYEGRGIWLKITLDGVSYKWPGHVWFSDNPNCKPTLGISGFLEFFTAIFDGEKKQLRLEANSTFPGEKVDIWNLHE